MPNPAAKQELLAAMTDVDAHLNEQITKMSEAELTAPFTCAADPTKRKPQKDIIRNLGEGLGCGIFL